MTGWVKLRVSSRGEVVSWLFFLLFSSRGVPDSFVPISLVRKMNLHPKVFNFLTVFYLHVPRRMSTWSVEREIERERGPIQCKVIAQLLTLDDVRAQLLKMLILWIFIGLIVSTWILFMWWWKIKKLVFSSALRRINALLMLNVWDEKKLDFADFWLRISNVWSTLLWVFIINIHLLKREICFYLFENENCEYVRCKT